MDRRASPTLKELAARLSLSPSTVSRVLNDPAGVDSKWASEGTSRRILALASELGYTRNPYAASLRTARTQMIGVVVPRLQDFVLASIYEGIDEAADEHGYVSVVANSLDSRELHDRRVRKLLDQRIDGLILGDTPFDGSTAKTVEAEGVPFVLVNRRAVGHVSVTCNDELGGRLAGEHLASGSPRRVFLLAGVARMSTSVDRTAGFRAVLGEAGIDLPDAHIVHGGYDEPAGEAGMRHLLATVGIPDAVFAVNDFAAIGALGVLRDHGLRVPDDVQLVGYNDTPLASGIGLTSVRSPMHQIGRQGLELLLARMNGDPVESRQLDPTLIVRTTG